MNRCNWCGKFKKWRELSLQFTPDTAFTSEKIEYKCKRCQRRKR